MRSEWTVVIPVKGTTGSKSRLVGSTELAQAIALDTVAAAVGAGKVIVVTTPAVAASFAALGAVTIPDPATGLLGAVQAGIDAAGPGPVAIMLGDLPALRQEELAAALEAATRQPLAMVPDAEGVGTTLITALRAQDHRPAFGAGSRALHVAAGYAELPVDADSGLRRDVDTAEQLAAVTGRVGARTAESLRRAPGPRGDEG